MAMTRKAGKTARARTRKVGRVPAKKATTALVKRVLNRNAETKEVCYYSGTQFPGITVGYQSNNDPQNGLIANNTGDLKFLIPPLKEGSTSFTRLGNKVQVKSLRLTLECSIVGGNINTIPNILNNIMVVIYIYQHKKYRDYATLSTQNNYNLFLDRCDGTYGSFTGNAIDSKLPVADQYYKLHKKIMFPLRNSGVFGDGQPGSSCDNVNSHPFMRRFTVDMTKFVPKHLTYGEVSPTPTQILDEFPTNSSLTMGIGFYNLTLTPLANSGLNSTINVNWSSKLRYKDF